MTQENFSFSVPVDTIEKGTNKQGKAIMKVGGCCSTDHQDTDEETLDPLGFQTEYFLSHGFINYNHQGKTNPSANIGEPTKAYLKDGQFHIEGELYGDNQLAKSTYETMESLKRNGSKRQMRWSIEGKVLERDPLDKRRVTKLLVTGAALTLTPKNTNTYAEILKGHFEGEIVDVEALSPVEVYSRIFNAFPDLEKGLADQVFALVESIANPQAQAAHSATPMQDNTPTTALRAEHVDQAFALLRGQTVTKSHDADEDDFAAADEDDEDVLIEKGIDSSIELLRQGQSRSNIVKSLLVTGLDADTAAATFRTAAGRFADELEDLDDEVVKGQDSDDDEDDYDDDEPADDSDDDDEDDDEDEAPKAAPSAKKKKKAGFPLNLKKTKDEGSDEVMKSMAASFDTRFAAMADLMDSVLTKIDSIGDTVEQRISQLEDAPMPRKSQLVTKSIVERQFGGQDVEKSIDGKSGRRLVSCKLNRSEVLDMLDARVDYNDPKNPASKKAMDELMHFEQIGQMEKGLANELGQKYGIELVN